MADEKKRVPGLAPDAEPVQDGVLGRYPSPPASQPNAPVRADSARAMIEEIVEQRIAEALGKTNERAAEVERQIRENQRIQAERQKARDDETRKRQEALTEYRALADGWVPHPDPRAGGVLVRKGEVFRFGGVPSARWMEPLTPEGEKRIKARQDQQAELARIRGEDQVALSALDKARKSIERASPRK